MITGCWSGNRAPSRQFSTSRPRGLPPLLLQGDHWHDVFFLLSDTDSCPDGEVVAVSISRATHTSGMGTDGDNGSGTGGGARGSSSSGSGDDHGEVWVRGN